MVHLLTFVNWLLPLLYFALLMDYGPAFLLHTKVQSRNPWPGVVIAVHAAFLVLMGIRLGYPPLVSSHEVLSVVALATAAVYWVVEIASRDRRMGTFVILLAFIFQYTSSTFLAQTIASPAAVSVAAQSNWARLHIVPAVVAYAGLAISAVYGVLHLVVRRDLKQHRFGLIFDRLPSLDQLGRMTWYALLVGFAFLTLTVATGPIIARQLDLAGKSVLSDPKVATKIIIGSIAWLTYAVAIMGRLVGKWSASRVSALVVNGFFVIMALLVVSVLLS